MQNLIKEEEQIKKRVVVMVSIKKLGAIFYKLFGSCSHCKGKKLNLCKLSIVELQVLTGFSNMLTEILQGDKWYIDRVDMGDYYSYTFYERTSDSLSYYCTIDVDKEGNVLNLPAEKAIINPFVWAIAIRYSYIQWEHVYLPLSKWHKIGKGKVRAVYSKRTGDVYYDIIDRWGNRVRLHKKEYDTLVAMPIEHFKRPKACYNDFVADIRAGLDIHNPDLLAKKYGVSKRTIYRWIEKAIAEGIVEY